ncbi:unnamed protein product [Arabidopsis lyrata]|uniref:Predicted protein n=1 Tax=Arabidopsis lyrata subsp. lyrata TaxID=81972 RepID=D7MBL0_ARALL|nr:predicted protein [Arabidopsis lyrata subsp. lyrata]CAH8274766.1 unnamed protein product [Arabidopsis lyrata]
MAKASATIIILLILFCSLACEARVRLTSPDLPTDEIVHKVEKLQQEHKRFPKSDPHFYPKKKIMILTPLKHISSAWKNQKETFSSLNLYPGSG